MGKTAEPFNNENNLEEWYDGRTHCYICDKYCCDKTPEQIREILDKIAKFAYSVLLKQETEKQMNSANTNK